jgi:hypothetical protein
MRGGDLATSEGKAGLRHAGPDGACSAVTVGRPLHVVSGTRLERSRVASAGMAFSIPTVGPPRRALAGRRLGGPLQISALQDLSV